MFPFQRGELSFAVSNNDLEIGTTNASNNIFLHQKVEQDVNAISSSTHPLQYHHDAHIASNLTPRSPNKRKGRSGKLLTRTHNNTNSHNKNDTNSEDAIRGVDAAQKRSIHREIERQRRQEMSNLYSSLRSLLPMEYTKGKRSVSDHIDEATKYIRDLEKNIKELGDKRDQLKGSSCSSADNKINKDIGCSSSTSTSSLKNNFNVSIHTFSKAIEIEITAGTVAEDLFPLSKALNVLIEEGLDVVSCDSSKVNQRWIYVIHCQAENVSSIDSRQLQLRLARELQRYNP